MLQHLDWNRTAPVQSGSGARNDQNTDLKAPLEIPGAANKFNPGGEVGGRTGNGGIGRSLLLLPNSAGSPEREEVPACLSVPNTIPECHCSRDNPGGERVDAYGERAAVVPEK